MSPMANPSPPDAPTVRLGTRSSQLALVQSNWVKQQLEQKGVSVQLVPIKTEGDLQSGPLAQIGGQGVFTKRIQIALLENEIDLAVHSLKDLPTADHSELMIAAIPTRANPFDALVSNHFSDVASLPKAATIGTGSVRRAAELLHVRHDLRIENIRGNVDTRLNKLDKGDFDAIVLACAGLIRLGQGRRITYQFPIDQMMPAVGQGALGIETRSNDLQAIAIAKQLNDAESFQGAMAERAMLQFLFAGCLTPIGAYSHIKNNELTLSGVVLSRDGRQRILVRKTGALTHAIDLGQQVAQSLLQQGADKLLK